MYTKNKKNPRGLKIFLVITYIVFALFAAFLLVFGLLASQTNDADFAGGIGDVFKYHFSGLPDLFAFKFNNASNIIYVALSGLLYLFIVIAVIYIIAGIIVSAKRKRAIVVPSLIASVLVVVVFMMMATGLPKYWAIINKRDAFQDDNTLVFLTVGILLSGGIFILFAYIAYFASLLETFKNPGYVKEEKEEQKEDVVINDSSEPQEEEPVVFEPVAEEVASEELIPLPEPETETEPEPEPEPEPAPKEPDNKPASKEDLRDLLKEVVRDIVRDEIARNNANQPMNNNAPASSITGATFGGPLVVQYFNGGINSAAAPEPVKEVQPAPVPQPQKEEVKEEPIPAPKEEKPAPEPEPVVEEKKPEPAPEPEPIAKEEEPEPIPEPVPVVEEPAPEPEPEPVVEEKKPEPAPVVPPVEEPAQEEEPAPEATTEKKPIIRIPFTERMINADAEMQKNYNELKNEILSYGVNSRVSNSGDTFRLHRKTYIKITIAGLSLKLYFALNPEDYKDSTLPIQDAGHKGIYEEIPLVFKVKSGLSMRRCKQLIADVFEKNGLEQGEIGNIDWVEQLKNAPQEDSKDED